MQLEVRSLSGETGGQIDLPDDVFGISEIRADILQRCVAWQLAKRRAGTHKVQVRNEVSRTGKKMYKQKGTGGARHGSRRGAPLVRGGPGPPRGRARTEVSRTGRKRYRQKGPGGARHGSRRAAQFVGGARAHGPVVRSHAFDLPKKVRALALRHALSSTAHAGNMIVLDNADLKEMKTVPA